MSDEKKKAGTSNWFHGLQSEFKKISWPDRDTLTRETVTVAVVSIILGIIIATLDMIIQYGINFLI
ncbi:MAG: preprotein translocase subunit SecE [Clostridiales bacterium]|nr:preprotein translocase subunit SecE [Clostridiales bacterium]